MKFLILIYIYSLGLVKCTKLNTYQQQINAFYVSEKYSLDTVLLRTDTSNRWLDITKERAETLKDTTWFDFSKCGASPIAELPTFRLEKLYWKIQITKK